MISSISAITFASIFKNLEAPSVTSVWYISEIFENSASMSKESKISSNVSNTIASSISSDA